MTTAQQIVMAVLRDNVTVPVVHKVPRPRPDLFVRVDQAAPRRTTPVTDMTTVFIQVYGPTLDDAVDLIDVIRERCFDLDVLDDRVLGWSEDSGPVDFPDPDIPDVTRWQFIGTLTQALL
ncbi:hypothetical protein [Corynebacterium variabile]|uniref:DUF3168 domain-containing protein n=1 Tax=Corynebacterium variabile TaxID=1727 RepID=A0A4Y4C5J5_9CORY|nr:hypothetical protein [Corynebacterium variabile]GEC87446.1 hypothetical protein CVA01_27600 [Corynebacterium variabile]